MDTPICLWMSLKHFRITTSNVFTRRCFNSHFGRLMQITRYKMIEVSTKHQLHEVPCFFLRWSLEWFKGHPTVRLVMTGPLMEIPSDGRFAKIWHLREIQKKCVPMKLAWKSLGGFRHTIFIHVQTHPGHNLRWIRWIRWYSMPSHCEIILKQAQSGHKPLKNHRVFKQSAMVSPIDYYCTHMHIPINH